MYVHSYQSYVWNSIVSERIRMFGAEKPAIGDLVFETEEEDDTELAVDGAEDELVAEDKVDKTEIGKDPSAIEEEKSSQSLPHR